MKTWITADWHLGEDRFELMGGPFSSANQMSSTLITNHNLLVAPEDKVIVVGDVCYQKAPEYLYQVAHFNGHKTLVRGNHDRVFTDEQLKPYFDTIIADGDGFAITTGDDLLCYVTHYPTEGRGDIFNLVGHIHAAWKYQLNMLNVGVDVHHFQPVDIDKIPFHLEAIKRYYDKDVWVAYDSANTKWCGLRGKKGTYFRPQADK
jgi:calcineurin-like phosphoesterase family protein